MYFVKAPWWLRRLFSPRLIWKLPVTEKPVVYLTFDDGPHHLATPFVLQELKAAGVKATFFCLGKCVLECPDLYQQTIADGHTIGNHTHNHLNGWKTTTADYLANIHLAAEQIDSNLFRPPYGRIRRAQVKELRQDERPWKICMWDVVSGDFDEKITPEKCLRNVVDNITPGSIIVFHDSQKAWKRMRYALPRVIAFCKEKGWEMRTITTCAALMYLPAMMA